MPRRQKKETDLAGSNDALTLLHLQQQVITDNGKDRPRGCSEASTRDSLTQFYQCTGPQNTEHSPKLSR